MKKNLGRFFLCLILLWFMALFVLPRIKNNSHLPRPQPDIPIPLAFDGNSASLKATEIVPTLDSPIPEHKNAVWCASFLASWKVLEQNLTKGPVLLDGNPAMVKTLNDAPDPRPSVSALSLYAAAGWNQSGIVAQIQNDMRRRFPDKPAPAFPGIMPDSLVAYAYLETHVKFPIPYNQNKEPLAFTNSAGEPALINSFGVTAEDANTFFKLRAQPRVIFRGNESWPGGSHGMVDDEFVIGLCPTSCPDQIIVAKIARPPTLAAGVAYVEGKITDWERAQIARQFEGGPCDSGLHSEDLLLVPDFNWFISHHFSELEGKNFVNPGLRGQPLSVAQEDIAFCLDKSGAGLRAESREYATAIPNDYVFNQPFLVYLKKRGAPAPYFAMWVDNAELLSPWSGPNSTNSVPSF